MPSSLGVYQSIDTPNVKSGKIYTPKNIGSYNVQTEAKSQYSVGLPMLRVKTSPC